MQLPATRLSIRTKLSIAAAAAFAIAMAAGVEHMYSAVERLHVAGHEERLKRLAETVRARISEIGPAAEDDARVAAMTARLGAYHEIDPLQLAEVLGPDLHVVASSNPVRIGQARRIARTDDAEAIVFREEVDGHRTLSIVEPLFAGRAAAARPYPDGKKPPFLVVSLSLEPVEAHIASMRRTIILTLIATLAFQLVALWVGLTVLAVRPIRELVAVMHRVEDGNLDLRVSERLIADEFNWLARTFNSMIQKQKETQRELDSYLRERMVRADRFATIGELASGIVHEIKNPLAGIWGALQVLAEGQEDEATRRKVIGLMGDQIQRVDRVLRDLHMFARPNQPEHALVSPNELLDRVWLLVRQHHAAASVVLMKELKAEQRVRGNHGQLEQVFMNICLNAAQAMASGGSLTVSSRDEGGSVVVEIADTGPGIPADLRAKIFKPFFTTKARGTGLGLTIAQQIVEDHSGELLLECPETGGTRVTIRLPAAAPEVASTPVPTARPGVERGARPAGER